MKLDPVLRGVFGRSLQTRVSADPRDAGADPATRVYLFAHETLRVTAEEQLGGELARYRQGIHDWIAPTPAQAGPIPRRATPYAATLRLLTATSDVTRLSALARDPRRHAFLLRATGSDYAALTEIRTAQRLIADQECLTCRLSSSWPSTGMQSPSATSPFRSACLPCGHGLLVSITPRPSPAPSPTPAPRPRRSPSWPPQPPRPADLDRASRLAADAEALARTITDPGHPGAGARRAGHRGRPGRRPATVRRGPRPHHHRLRRPGRGAHRAGHRGRPSRRPGPRRGPRPHHHRPRRPGPGARRAGHRGRPGRRPGPRVPAGRRRRGPRPHHHRPLCPGAGAHRAGRGGRPAGDPDRAEALARTITDRRAQAQALTELATAAAQRRPGPRRGPRPHHHRPRAQARRSPSWPPRPPRPATRTAPRALARTITDPDDQALGARQAGPATAQAGDLRPRRGPGPYHHRPRRPGAGARRRWPPRPPRPGTWTARPGWPPTPRPSPAPSPTLTPRPGAHRAGTAAAQAGRPGPRRGPRPRHHRPRSTRRRRSAEAGHRDRRGGRPGPRRGTRPRHHRPRRQAQALTELATRPPRPGTRTARPGWPPTPRPSPAPSPTPRQDAGAHRAGHRGRPGRGPGPRRGPRPHHHRPMLPARALAGLAAAAAQAGDLDRAEALARTITDPDIRPGRSPSWPPQPPRPGTRTARPGWPLTPRPSPAPSPTRSPRRGRSPEWPPRPPRPATRTAPRPWPAPSPTRATGREALAD